MARRIGFLDIIKAISIVLVVFIHFNVLSNDTIIGNVVMQFAISACPCFMMVSGFLQAGKRDTKHFAAKLLKIYFQLSIWKVLYFLFWTLIMKVNYVWSLGTFIRYVFFFGNYPDIDTGFFWYINAMLMCVLIYPVLAAVENDKVVMYLMVLAFLSGIGVDVLNSVIIGIGIENFTFVGLRNILPLANQSMLFFYLLGWVIKIKWGQIEKTLQKPKFFCISIFMMICGVMGGMVLKYIQADTWRWEGIYLNNPYNRLSTVVLAVGLFALISQLSNIPDGIRFLLSKIGQNTLVIYYLHFMIAAGMKRCFFNSHKDIFSFGLNVVRTVFIVGLCYGGSWAYNCVIQALQSRRK